MKVRELLLMCWMAYLDLPPLYAAMLVKGQIVPAAALADYTLRMDVAGKAGCVRLNAPARAAAREMLRSPWLIKGYINDNDSHGFAAYEIDADGTNVVAMRGSERAGECVASDVDWVDNVCEPFIGSVQTEAIRELTGRYRDGVVIYTGHSKGGHNALLALAASENPAARAAAFNGQGFADGALDEAQEERLGRCGVNYVVAGDIVGALLRHPEKRIFVRQNPETNAHMPEAFMFDENGAPVRGMRTAKSYAVEAVSRIAGRKLADSRRIAALCRAALNG